MRETEIDNEIDSEIDSEIDYETKIEVRDNDGERGERGSQMDSVQSWALSVFFYFFNYKK